MKTEIKMMKIFLSGYSGSLTFILLFLMTSAWGDWASPPRIVRQGTELPVGNPDAHHNSGGRRMVRINGTTIVIAPEGGGERTYRSTNNGVSWERIDTDGIFSGCLITGPGEMVYHFYVDHDGGRISMVKFRYDAPAASIPAPRIIYSNPALAHSGILSYYQMLNAIIDRDGVLYVATHWDPDNSDNTYFDHIFLFSSADGGNTWSAPSDILSHPSKRFYYSHLEVNTNNQLMATHRDDISSEVIFSKRESNGTWTHTSFVNDLNNPALLTVGDNDVVIVAQTYSNFSSGLRGVVYRKSTNAGLTFPGSWILLEGTCGYGDPSAALGDNGDIYVAFRSDNYSGATGDGCGERSREKLAVIHPNGGVQIVDNYLYDASGALVPRTGTRSQLRYQTWFNYGGPLEWIWMQYSDSAGSGPVYIYYDINVDVLIKDSSVIPSSPPARPRQLRLS